MKSKAVRANWAEVLRRAEGGETITIEHYNRTVARLVPNRDSNLDRALHQTIQHARRHADHARACNLHETHEYASTLTEVEMVISMMVTHLTPWADAATHLRAVRVATREHYLPSLMMQMSGTWREVEDRWENALYAVGADVNRIQIIGGITHAEAVAACDQLGIPAPDQPVSISGRIQESLDASRQDAIDRGENPDDW